MKKYFLVFFLFPLVGFCDDVVYSYTPYSYNTSGKLTPYASYVGTKFSNVKYDTVFSLILNQSWVPLSFFYGSSRLFYPSFSYPFTNSVQNSSFPFLGSDGIAYSFGHFPETANIFVTVIHLYVNGYRNDNFIKDFVDNGSIKASTCNVSPLNIYLDVLNGTNTLYRQIVLNSLNDINNNLLSIDDQFSDFLSSYRTVNSEALSGFSNLSNKISSLTLSGLMNINNANRLLDSLDTNNYDLESSEQQEAYNSLVNSIASGINLFDQLSGLSQILKYSDDPNHQEAGIEKLMQILGNDFNDSLSRSLSGSISSSSSIASSNVVNAVRMSTNWVDGVKKDLQKWSDEIKKSSISSITNSNGTLPVSGKNGAPVAVSGYVEISNPNSLSVNLDGPIELSASTLNQLSSSNQAVVDRLISIHDLFNEWYRFDPSHSWVSFFDLYRSYSDSITKSLADINSHTNFLSKLDDIYDLLNDLNLTNLSLSVSNEFHYLLLDDYDDFISNNHYFDFLDKLQSTDSPYSELLDSLDAFDESTGSGNWWRFISANQAILGSSVVSTTTMVSFFYSNLVSTLQFADDNLPDGYFSQALNVISNFPTVAEAEYKIYSVTQAVYSAAAGFDDVYSSLGSTSNEYVTVVSGLYLDRSLPDSISLCIIPDHPFSIPVSEFSDLWNLLRLGMAFAISIVNLILLPKFILKLFSLFFGVYDSEVRISDSVPH